MKTFAKDANFPPVFSGIQIHVAQSLVFCVVLCGLLFVLFLYFLLAIVVLFVLLLTIVLFVLLLAIVVLFGHCIVCLSLIYGF
jgi:hypothetical protein